MEEVAEMDTVEAEEEEDSEALDPKPITFDQLYHPNLPAGAFFPLYKRWERQERQRILGR